MREVRDQNCLVSYQNEDAPAAYCIVICKSCGCHAKVASDWTVRIVTGDVDWANIIMGYEGVRTHRALVGVRIEVCPGFNNINVE